MNQSRKDSRPHMSSRTSVRSSARSADRANAKDDALNELSCRSSSQSGSGSRSEDEEATGDSRIVLNYVWGKKSSTAGYQMAMVSDSPPIKEEFDLRVKEVKRSDAPGEKQMLQEKKSATWRPLNIAAEKDRLRRGMEVALCTDDEAEVERIKARLFKLEASQQTQGKDKKDIKLAEMNRKNRAGYDPFSRLWTRSRNYNVAKSSIGNEATVAGTSHHAAVGPDSSEAAGVVTSEAGAIATAAVLEAAADAWKCQWITVCI
ncbi:hypothetical protein AgCh_020346 [Apium graveolens]